jgi:hypothetical protein
MYDGDSNYRVRWEGTETYGVGVIIEHKSASKEMKNMKMFESLNKFDRLDAQSERNVQSSTLNENQMFKQMLNQSRSLLNEEPQTEIPMELPTFGQQSPKIFGSGTGRPLVDYAGGKGNASQELMNNVNSLVKDKGLTTMVVPAPDKDKADNEQEITAYNQQLNDFLKKYFGNLNLEIEWSPLAPLSFVEGKYQMKGEEDIISNTSSGEAENLPTFGQQSPKIFGSGTGRPLVDYAGGKGNASQELMNSINNLIKDKGISTVVVPAPDKDKATSEQEVTTYNQQLNDFLKKYYKYSGTEIEWSPLIPLSFIEGKYKVKGEKSEETGSQAKINTTNDRAFDYKLENGKYYFKGKKTGAYASRFPNWVEATGEGLKGIKANVKF